MAGDNGIAKYDAATGAVQIGEAQLDDSGNILMVAGTAVNWDSGAVAITEGGAGVNTVAFTGPSLGYVFQDGPVRIDGRYLEGSNQTSTSSSFLGAVSGRTKLSFSDYDGDGVLVAGFASGSLTNGKVYPLTGVWNNLILHSDQCTVSGFGTDVSQGTMFWLTAQPNAGAVFALSNGTTTREYGATSGGDVQYTIGATLLNTLANIAAAITSDGTGLWDAVHITNNLSGVHSGATAGCVVIFRSLQPNSSGEDRIYETVSFSTGNPQTINFGVDPDYRRASDSAAAISLPSSDPGSRSFGFGKRSNTSEIRTGEIFPAVLDLQMNIADRFSESWYKIGASVRSDASGTDVIGSSATPQVLNLANTYFTQTGFTDTRDFGDCVWHVTCEDKGTATKLTVKVEWSEDASNLSSQGSESISAGVSTLSEYIAEYDISGETAPFNLPAILLPVAAPNAQVSVKSDIGTTTEVYVRAWRKA